MTDQRIRSLARRQWLRAVPAAALVSAGLHVRSARAQSGSTVAMYTAAPTELQNALLPVLRSSLGLTMQVVSAGGGELMKRLQAESSRPMADVLVSVGGDGIDASPALFTPYRVKDADKLQSAYLQSPLWTPLSVTVPTVVAVNTQKVPEAEIPTRWAELADPKWKGRIAFGAADRSSSALGQLMHIIHIFGEQPGWELFTRMMDNFVLIGSSGAVIRGTAQGEYAMCLTLEDNAQRFIDGGAPLKIVYPKEGVNASADAMALVTRGPNPAGGRAVLDFLASTEGQALVVKSTGRRPTRTDVPGPTKNVPFSSLPVNNYPIDWAAAKSGEYLRRYLRLARR